MSRLYASTFVRRVLAADAVTRSAAGLLMVAAAGPLDGLLDVPAILLRYAGLSLLPFAAFVAWLATQTEIPRAGVWTVIVLNMAWVVGCVLLLIGGPIAPNGFGVAFILVQAITVGVLGELQYVGLRKGASQAAIV